MVVNSMVAYCISLGFKRKDGVLLVGIIFVALSAVSRTVVLIVLTYVCQFM